MDRFLKRTEHPVWPVLPAPKKPKVISASFRVQEFEVYFYESGGKSFLQKLQLGY